MSGCGIPNVILTLEGVWHSCQKCLRCSLTVTMGYDDVLPGCEVAGGRDSVLAKSLVVGENPLTQKTHNNTEDTCNKNSE